jgi:hypothetical protein
MGSLADPFRPGPDFDPIAWRNLIRATACIALLYAALALSPCNVAIRLDQLNFAFSKFV